MTIEELEIAISDKFRSKGTTASYHVSQLKREGRIELAPEKKGRKRIYRAKGEHR